MTYYNLGAGPVKEPTQFHKAAAPAASIRTHRALRKPTVSEKRWGMREARREPTPEEMADEAEAKLLLEDPDQQDVIVSEQEAYDAYGYPLAHEEAPPPPPPVVVAPPGPAPVLPPAQPEVWYRRVPWWAWVGGAAVVGFAAYRRFG